MMSEMNPYTPPESPAAAAAAANAGNFITTGRAVDAGRGWEWIASGFALFRKQPGIWILMVIVVLACSILIGLVPVIGGLASMLLLQVFAGGIMLGCRALDRGENFEVGYVFAGFKQNTSNLVVLGLLALVAWIIILIPAMMIMGGGSFLAVIRGGSDLASVAALGLTFALAMLVVLSLSIPLYMALWFAPALIVFHELKPVDAMKASFFACLKNVMPFLLYSVILLVLSMIAAIPFGLGFLVLVPVVVASIYTAYRDIFFAG
jgi:hypothetical protein